MGNEITNKINSIYHYCPIAHRYERRKKIKEYILSEKYLEKPWAPTANWAIGQATRNSI
jgi:hypothetical protein